MVVLVARLQWFLIWIKKNIYYWICGQATLNRLYSGTTLLNHVSTGAEKPWGSCTSQPKIIRINFPSGNPKTPNRYLQSNSSHHRLHCGRDLQISIFHLETLDPPTGTIQLIPSQNSTVDQIYPLKQAGESKTNFPSGNPKSTNINLKSNSSHHTTWLQTRPIKQTE